MAANFWLSSHANRWLFTDSKQFAISHARDLPHFQTKRNLHRVHLFFIELLYKLGKGLGLKNRIICTAIVFWHRFYAKKSFTEHDPRIVTPTLLFLAAKAEECGLNATRIIAELQKLAAVEGPESNTANMLSGSSSIKPLTSYGGDSMSRMSPSSAPQGLHLAISPATARRMFAVQPLELVLLYEFICLQVLDFDLIVYHPHRDLVQYLADAGAADCLQTAWNITNDSYRTTVCLLYPPFLIGIAAIYIACTFHKKNCQDWLQRLDVDLEEVYAIAREILALYSAYEDYNKAAPIDELLLKLDSISGATSAPPDMSPVPTGASTSVSIMTSSAEPHDSTVQMATAAGSMVSAFSASGLAHHALASAFTDSGSDFVRSPAVDKMDVDH